MNIQGSARELERRIGEDYRCAIWPEGIAPITGHRVRFVAIMAKASMMCSPGKSGLKSQPRTDVDCRVLRKRGKTVIGYKADIAVSEDHFSVVQRVGEENTDNQSLQPMVDQVENKCHQPQKVVADPGFYSNANVAELEKDHIDGFVPDSNMASMLNKGGRFKGRAKAPEMKRMRAKLRIPEGRQIYTRRKQIVETPFGTIKTQRDLASFRLRGKGKVGIEFSLGGRA
jgi:hypothetical protein